MSDLQTRISEAQARHEMQSRWRGIVSAAGLDSDQHSPEQTYELAGNVLHDRTVAGMRAQTEFQIADREFPAAVETNWTKLFEKLGPGGRAALKERIAKAQRL